MSDKRLRIIVDCNAVAYRVYWGMPQDLSFQGNDTSIIYGFLMQIRKLAEDFKSNQFLFVWDSPKSYRKMIYPQYKANRLSQLTDIQRENLKIAKDQFEELEFDVLPAMGFKNIYSVNGYEADDIIAYFTIRLPDNYLIVSSDEDLYQLLYRSRSVECRIYNGRKVFTLDDFVKGYGLNDPTDWIRVKAIAGCSTDNVQGVEGVGETKAIQYLRGTLPDGKVKKRIQESKDIIQRNLDLVCLPFVRGAKPLIPSLDYPGDDELFAVDFMETFRNYGFASFLGDNFQKWRSAFALTSGESGKNNG